jgi:hypothetical protein
MVESYGKDGNAKSIRQKVFALLDENQLFTPQAICQMLNLYHAKYCRYISKLKCEWKHYRQNEQGSNCSSVHAWQGRCRVPTHLDRVFALEVGWKPTKAKNRWLEWKEKLGLMMWFENGTVYLHVKSPVNLGKVKQLVCNGFGKTGLIYEIGILDEVVSTIRPTRAHYIFDAKVPLPRKTITYFDKSHGLTIKIGDKSHPNAVEVESRVPDWTNHIESSFEKFASLLDSCEYKKDSLKKPDYVV